MARVRKYKSFSPYVYESVNKRSVGECLCAVLFVDDDAKHGFGFREEGRARFRDVSSLEGVVRAASLERKVGNGKVPGTRSAQNSPCLDPTYSIYCAPRYLVNSSHWR